MKLPPTFFLICALLLTIPLFSHAQLETVGSADNLAITIKPAYPKPNDDVTISIESYSVDLNTSAITWSLNGKVKQTGIGKKQFNFNAGPLGTQSAIHISVIPLSGSPVQQDTLIAPAAVNFVWQAKTYTPPFYMGKSLFTGQASAIITAVPEIYQNGTAINPDNLIYQWTKNGTILSDQSGYGKKSISLDGNYWGTAESIAVAVSAQNSTLTAQGVLKLQASKPQVIVYEDSPLLGVLYNHAVLGSFSLNSKEEASLFAAPYFFLSDMLAGGKTTYEWNMNNKMISPKNSGDTLTFRNDSGETGSSALSVKASQDNMTFQNASTNFSIEFK